LIQQDKQLVVIGWNAKIRESSEFGRKPENKLVRAVQIFHDVSYLKFDPTTRVSIVPQALRTEMVALGSCHFRNRDKLLSGTGERSITPAHFKRRLANGEEMNRS